MLGIRRSNIPAFLEWLSRRFEVIAPVERDGQVIYDITSNPKLDYQNTAFPPRKFFLPNHETLFEFKRAEARLVETRDRKRRLIFGMRPCDVHALFFLDRVFRDDPYYRRRRRLTAIVAMACDSADEYCFCGSLGTDWLNAGYDLLLIPSKEGYAIEVGSERGSRLSRFDLLEEFRRPARPRLRFERELNVRLIAERLMLRFDSSLWEEDLEECLSCAACAIACPTCSCFDLVDVLKPNGDVQRKRVWNFCLLRGFTRVAGDFIYRKDRVERLKHFIYHKLCYSFQRRGVFACVGCGRCLRACKVGIDWLEVVGSIA
jgi:ferredoxin